MNATGLPHHQIRALARDQARQFLGPRRPMSKPRIAVVSPFIDKRHGTERAVAECVQRLSGEYEIHVYSNRVEDLDLDKITWHRIPALPGPHLLRIFLVVSGEPSLAMVGPPISRAYPGACFFAGNQLSGRGCDLRECCLRAIARTHERAVAVQGKPVEYVASDCPSANLLCIDCLPRAQNLPTAGNSTRCRFS